MSCGIGHRCASDPALLWLWRRPAAVTLIGPLAWESPYAAGAALKKQSKKKKKIHSFTHCMYNWQYRLEPDTDSHIVN